MSKMPWHVFKNAHPRAHGAASGLRLPNWSAVPTWKTAKTISTLIKTLGAHRLFYSTSIVSNRPAPKCSPFENELDARNWPIR